MGEVGASLVCINLKSNFNTRFREQSVMRHLPWDWDFCL